MFGKSGSHWREPIPSMKAHRKPLGTAQDAPDPDIRVTAGYLAEQTIVRAHIPASTSFKNKAMAITAHTRINNRGPDTANRVVILKCGKQVGGGTGIETGSIATGIHDRDTGCRPMEHGPDLAKIGPLRAKIAKDDKHGWHRGHRVSGADPHGNR